MTAVRWIKKDEFLFDWSDGENTVTWAVHNIRGPMMRGANDMGDIDGLVGWFVEALNDRLPTFDAIPPGTAKRAADLLSAYGVHLHDGSPDEVWDAVEVLLAYRIHRIEQEEGR